MFIGFKEYDVGFLLGVACSGVLARALPSRVHVERPDFQSHACRRNL